MGSVGKSNNTSKTSNESSHSSISKFTLQNERTMYFDKRETKVYDNPLPLAPEEVIDAFQWGGNDYYEVNSIIDHRVNGIGVGKIESVPVSKLGSIQDFIENDRVQSMIKTGKKPDEIKSQNGTSGIAGFRYNDKIYIYDGNHRVVAAMMSGQKNVKVEIDMEIKKRRKK